jgi:hypothetical protein
LAGDVTKAKVLLAKVSEEDRLKCPYPLAQVYVSLGETDAALSALEQAYKIHQLALLNLKVDPMLDGIRSEPRFKALVHKMGFE